ncbi:cytochrome b561 and DOMON domain-containing protein At5g47530-like [Prosopis cineraria]|uniref:cytochrome b561 and DOMON domain-containing protein At5g47530-like n=1 Tax=Prosopis cineraria TaxID=364024 RepID=UPI00240F33B6|nr:cytochrome b561 and DOMON domain-containing protein At5g47530-like [Prosopis cineraria]
MTINNFLYGFFLPPSFLVLFFIGLTLTTPTTAAPQPKPQSCNDLLLLDSSICNYRSSSDSKFHHLPENSTLVNHIWQQGSLSSGSDVKSFGHIDFVSSQVSHDDDNDDRNSDKSEILIRKVHGILSGIGWGILMPTGAMVARYLKAFKAAGFSWWFNLHMACQIVACLSGTTSFALGIYMAIDSDQFSDVHGYIGFAIYCASTAQVVLALNYRPDEGDKDKILWNICHYVIGYGVIVLAIFGMFKGFSISNSCHHHRTWNNAFFGTIVSLGCVAFIVEVATWFLVCGNRKEEEENSDDNV